VAKTLSDLLLDWRQHISQTDTTNTNFTNAQGTIWANDAYRAIVAKLRHLPITLRSYTVASYALTLNSNTVAIDEVHVKNPDATNADGSNKYEPLEVIDIKTLVEMDPNYFAATSAIPRYLARNGTFAAILYPPPKASLVALTTPLRTIGLELPTELSSDSDTPDLPGNLHDIIPHWMAYRSFSQLENQPKATEHITLWSSRLKDNKGLATEFSRQLNQFSWEEGVF
jgi:hypothetical protein